MNENTPEDVAPLEVAIACQEQALDRQLGWIGAVDSKTPTVIGLATTMLAALGLISPEAADVGWLQGGLIALGAVPLFGCLFFCARATFPVTHGPTGSMIFFGGIAELPLNDYCEKAKSHSKADHFQDLCQQVHRNAQIASAKFKHLQMAMWFLFGGTVTWLIAGYFLYKG